MQWNYGTLFQRKIRIYLDNKCMDFFLKIYFLTIIITAKRIAFILAISRGIRKCLPPVMPLSCPIPTSKVFRTGPWGKEKVEEDLSLFWWNLEVAFLINFMLLHSCSSQRSHPVLTYTLLTMLLRGLYKSLQCLLLCVRSRLEHMG